MMAFARVAVARFRHFAKPFSTFPCKGRRYAFFCFSLHFDSLLFSSSQIHQLDLVFVSIYNYLSRHCSHLLLLSIHRLLLQEHTTTSDRQRFTIAFTKIPELPPARI